MSLSFYLDLNPQQLVEEQFLQLKQNRSLRKNNLKVQPHPLDQSHQLQAVLANKLQYLQNSKK